jgi:hypothetical protein
MTSELISTMPPEDRDFYVELTGCALLAWAIVALA